MQSFFSFQEQECKTFHANLEYHYHQKQTDVIKSIGRHLQPTPSVEALSHLSLSLFPNLQFRMTAMIPFDRIRCHVGFDDTVTTKNVSLEGTVLLQCHRLPRDNEYDRMVSSQSSGIEDWGTGREINVRELQRTT